MGIDEFIQMNKFDKEKRILSINKKTLLINTEVFKRINLYYI